MSRRHKSAALVAQDPTLTRAMREFEDKDGAEVYDFLDHHPDLLPLLPAIRRHIRKHFVDDTVNLELFSDPDWEPADWKLLVAVQTPRPSGDALRRLRQFDREWWLEKREQTDAPVIVSIEHVRGI